MPRVLVFIISFFIILFVAWKQAKAKLYHERLVFDSTILTILGIVVGARALYVFLHFSEFGFNILKWIVFGLYPGFSVGGAFLGGAVVFLTLSDKKTLIQFQELADLLTRSLALSIPLFLAGALTGRTEPGVPLQKNIAAHSALNSHPVTFYKLLAFFVLDVVFYFLSKKNMKLKPGFFSLSFWLSTLAVFFSIDFLKRFDVYYWKLGADQWIYALLFLLLAIVLAYQIKDNVEVIKKHDSID